MTTYDTLRFRQFGQCIRFLFTLFFALSGCVSTAKIKIASSALEDYVKSPDSHFSWKFVRKTKGNGGTIHSLEMNSQEWHGIVWKHSLEIYEPNNVHFPNHALLFIAGGSNPLKTLSPDPQAMELANLIHAPIMYLHQVPNQPLLEGKKEDDLIAETFTKYQVSGDSTWLLLLPMVKSATRAIDVLQEYSEKEWKRRISEVVVTGLSKRGWTTWLTAVADKRLIAIAPMAIDSLNFHKQMQNQAETWGHYSPEVDDYSKNGLIESENNKHTKSVWNECDPYIFRDRLSLPKLIINATNDKYWVVDALNIYWDDLIGEKWIQYLPNSPHDIRRNQTSPYQTLAAFFRARASHRSLPRLKWNYEKTAQDLHLKITSDPKTDLAALWVAHSSSKDFHSSIWVKTQIKELAQGAYDALIPKPAGDHIAVFGELTYFNEGMPYTLSTQMHME